MFFAQAVSKENNMSDVAPGYQEMVYSQSEKIGLPNWSFFTILVSAKAAVPSDQAQHMWDFLHAVVDSFTQERAEQISRDLGLFGGSEGGLQTRDEAAKAAISNVGLTYASAELTYSQTEVIGLPEKSSVNYLGSSKMLAAPGTELDMFRYLASSVGRQMYEKRDAIKANPRPWCISK